MNEKITLQTLAQRLSEECSVSPQQAESFIRSYFDTIAETLLSGDNVKAKGLGTFKCVGIEARESVDVNTGRRVVIPGHRRPGFSPDKSMADKVNAPFAAFEAVEIGDSLSDDDLDRAAEECDADTRTESESVEATAETSETVSPVLPLTPEEVEVEMPKEEVLPLEAEEEVQICAAVAEDKHEDNPSDKPTEPTEKPATPQVFHDYDEPMPPVAPPSDGNRKLLTGFLIGIACMFAVLGGLWCWYRFAPDSFDSVLGRPSEPVAEKPAAVVASVTTEKTEVIAQETMPEQVDSPREELEQVAEVPTESSDKELGQTNGTAEAEPVYDTISNTRFLTTMARDHYGSFHLWPYIYMENSKILGHPDRIKPGTKVVIPPASKYGIDARDKACVAKAKKMGVEIYSRYK